MWERISKTLNDVEEWFLVVTIAANVLLVFYQVIMRYVFQNSLSWSEELARYLFLWYSWVGTSYAVRFRGHLRVEMFANMLKGRTRKWFELLVIGIWFLFSLFLAYQGVKVTRFIAESQQLSSAMQIPMAWAYASVPVGCALMSLRLLGDLWDIWKKLGCEEGPA